jgi:hypothetical protein
MRLAIPNLRGSAPRVAPQLLPDNAASRVINARLQSGDLEAWRQFALTHELANENSAQTIYLLSDRWLSWEVDVDVARGAIPGDTTFRTYLTGPDVYPNPRFTNYALATTGAEPFPVTTRPLGVPAPESQPTLVAGVSTNPTQSVTEVIDNGDQLETAWVHSANVALEFERSIVTQEAGDGNGPPCYQLQQQENHDYPCWLRRNFGIEEAQTVFVSFDFEFNDGNRKRMLAHILADDGGQGPFVRWSSDGGLLIGIAAGFREQGLSALVGVGIGDPGPNVWYTCQISVVKNPDNTRTVRAGIYLGSVQIGTTAVVTNGFVNKGDNVGFSLMVAEHTTSSDPGEDGRTRYDNILVRSTVPVDAVTQTPTSYVYTFVNDLGEESAPSPPSSTILKDDGTAITVTTATSVPTSMSDEYGITTKRIYRAVITNTGTQFQFVAEIPLAQEDFVDDLTDGQLGEVLESELFELPPDDLRGIIALPNGVMAGFSKNQLCFSVQNRPHAWPVEWRLNTDTEIVAIGNIDTTVIIGTKAFPYLAIGNDPSAYSMTKLEVPQACVSKRSLAYLTAIGVVFASPDGLIAITGNGQVRNLTETIFTRKQWQALRPATILGIAHDDVYHFWSGEIGTSGVGEEEAVFFDDYTVDTAGSLAFKFPNGANPGGWSYNDSLDGNLSFDNDNRGVGSSDGGTRSNFASGGDAITSGNWTGRVVWLQDNNNFGSGLSAERTAEVQFGVAELTYIGIAWDPGLVNGPNAVVVYGLVDEVEEFRQEIDFAATDDPDSTLTAEIIVDIDAGLLTVNLTLQQEGTATFNDTFVVDLSFWPNISRIQVASSDGDVDRIIFTQSVELLTGGEGPPVPGDEKGHALDMKPTGFGLVELGHHAIAAHADPLTDNLYLVLDANEEPFEAYLPLLSSAPETVTGLQIYEFDSSEAAEVTPLVYLWRKFYLLRRSAAFVYCQVEAGDFTNLLLNFYANGELLFTQVVASDEPFTLPLQDEYRNFEIEIVGTSRVQNVKVAEDIRELDDQGR